MLRAAASEAIEGVEVKEMDGEMREEEEEEVGRDRLEVVGVVDEEFREGDDRADESKDEDEGEAAEDGSIEESRFSKLCLVSVGEPCVEVAPSARMECGGVATAPLEM